jgi:hypothetical protein
VTEDEFNRCTDPQQMLTFLRGRASERKLRLFAVACGRRYCHVWEESARRHAYYRRVKPSVDDLCRRIVDAAERYADGQGTAEKVDSLRREMRGCEGMCLGLSWAATAAMDGDAAHFARQFADWTPAPEEPWDGPAEQLFQAALLRDLLGPLPFRPVTIPAPVLAWNSGCVVKLAAAIYEERKLPEGTLDAGRLAVLADTLEEAGLDNQDVLQHLREQGGVHVRGCWVLDLLLNKGSAVTEAEWLGETGHSQRMMHVLQERKLPRTKAGRRKLRLFACGCCRAAWDRLPDARLGDAVKAAEEFADGLASREELDAAGAAISWMREDSSQPAGTPVHVRVAIDMAVAATDAQAYSAAFSMTAMSLPLARCRGEERAGETALCNLIRCVFGNPFHPLPPVAPAVLAWQGGTLAKLAEAIYEDRRWQDMPILADALEEAGCSNQDILGHLRGPGPHARGCWVVDGLLGRG